MTKKIYLVRHAKSPRAYNYGNDIDRNIEEKGIMRTNLINSYLVENNVKIDILLTSNAVRTIETAKIIAPALGYDTSKILSTEKLYNCNIDKYFDIIFEQDDNLDSIMIIGHNPAITDFVRYFINEPDEYLPTSAVASLSFDCKKWIDIFNAKKELLFLITPKMLI